MGAEFASRGGLPPLNLFEALRLMDTTLPNPALAAAAPADLTQPAQLHVLPPWSRKRISETIEGVVFYGLLAFGVLFPIAATIYAVIVY